MVIFGKPKTCVGCKQFSPITDIVGYCTLLKVMDKGNTVVMDSKRVFDKLNWADSIEYKHVVVRSHFGCILWEKK